MGDWAAQEGDVLQAGHVDVADEAAAAAQVARVFFSRCAGTDAEAFGGHGRFPPCHGRPRA